MRVKSLTNRGNENWRKRVERDLKKICLIRILSNQKEK